MVIHIPARAAGGEFGLIFNINIRIILQSSCWYQYRKSRGHSTSSLHPNPQIWRVFIWPPMSYDSLSEEDNLHQLQPISIYSSPYSNNEDRSSNRVRHHLGICRSSSQRGQQNAYYKDPEPRRDMVIHLPLRGSARSSKSDDPNPRHRLHLRHKFPSPTNLL